jgi:hypothetical protein
MAFNYDPAKQACDPNYNDYRMSLQDALPYTNIGPGGKTTNIENDEKGILDGSVLRVVDTTCYAALGSDHDSHRMGIYATNSVGDRD